jgi:hypothetical protein
MFHAKNGLCFERIKTLQSPEGGTYGSVRIAKVSGPDISDGLGETLAILEPNEWASVCASMSAIGENDTTFRMFEALQK